MEQGKRAGREFEIDAWRDGMNVRCMGRWTDEKWKTKKESWDCYCVGERTEFRTRMNAECTGGWMDAWNNAEVQESKLVPTDMKEIEEKMRDGCQSVGVGVRDGRCHG